MEFIKLNEKLNLMELTDFVNFEVSQIKRFNRDIDEMLLPRFEELFYSLALSYSYMYLNYTLYNLLKKKKLSEYKYMYYYFEKTYLAILGEKQNIKNFNKAYLTKYRGLKEDESKE